MDDIPMMDESPESTPQQQRFNIADVLGASSHSDSSSFFSDMAEPDERIVRDRLRALYPYLDEKKHALPRHWSTSDRHQTLSISSDFLRVRNRGKGKEQKDAAAVRSDRPIPRACGLYYFEITVVTKPHGRPGIKKDERKSLFRLLGVGLCEKNVGTNRLPGWDQTSYGYHGDDGHFFCSSGQGREYGPTFDIGDTIGCGINFVTREIFFTRNGQHLGVAKRDVNITQDLYPVVGMQSPDEMVDANFGQKPFAYDIKKDMEAVTQSAIESVNDVVLPPQKSIWMSRAVSAWMAHEGYVRALEAFNSATLQVEKESGESIENRRAIIRLVQNGKVGDAIAKTEQCYPSVFKNKQLLLMLKIQQFVEMLRDVSQVHSRIHGLTKRCFYLCVSAGRCRRFAEWHAFLFSGFLSSDYPRVFVSWEAKCH
ncbi:RAN binding protein 9 [Aphelenchoides avenae]|nr:RAN binding protein 9 [Aphelenchus avenae]